jgi:mRNA interferase MazF
LKRGEVWTLSGGSDYASKPRPAVIVHSDAFPDQAGVTIVAFTSTIMEVPLIRIDIIPSSENGLEKRSQLMIDKISSVPKSELGKRIGMLTAQDMASVDRALVIYLGLSG